MAIYHYQVQNIGRSSGRSAVACAAYRAGERLYCRETGTEKDYTRKDKVDEKMILAPSNAPDWVHNREDLWNEIHAKENRKNSRFCREVNVAFPRELSSEAQVRLIREFVQSEYVDKGMVADVCCHNLEGHNPHAHIMLPTREITPEGFGKKERAWNDKKMLLQQREAWATHCNRSLEREGIRERIDHRSLKEQGIDREPTIHLGSRPHPERVARLEVIRERNRTLGVLKKELREIVSKLDVALQKEQGIELQRNKQSEAGRDVAQHLFEHKRTALRNQKDEQQKAQAEKEQERDKQRFELLREASAEWDKAQAKKVQKSRSPFPTAVKELSAEQQEAQAKKALAERMQKARISFRAAVKKELSAEQQEERAQAARDRAEFLAAQKRMEEEAEQQRKDAQERKEQEKMLLRSAGVWTSSEAQEQRKHVERELADATWRKNIKKQEYERLKSEKGLLTIFKNRRLTAEMKLVDAEYTKWLQTEKQLQGRVEQLDKAYNILRERERPAREEREREEREERARRRALYEREKAQVAALDPRYKKIVESFWGTVGDKIAFEKRLAAAKNDQERDKMVSSQKNLSRGRGRGR